jgi:putative hydrolase of the HAD superfamily
MIKVVLFDFGGVLTESGKKGFIAQTLGKLYDMPASEMDVNDFHYSLRRGQAKDDQLFIELNARYGKQITKEMFLAEVHKTFVPSQDVFKLAEDLRRHGIRTGILSNIFAMNAEVLRREGWYDGFDPVVLSCEEGVAKPDKGMYTKAIKRTGVRPEEILFIDDQDKCMPPALALGMHTVLAISPPQIVSDVKRVLQEQNGIEL